MTNTSAQERARAIARATNAPKSVDEIREAMTENDGYPFSLLTAHAAICLLLAALTEAKRQGAEEAAVEVERLAGLYDEDSKQRSVFAAVARSIRALSPDGGDRD